MHKSVMHPATEEEGLKIKEYILDNSITIHGKGGKYVNVNCNCNNILLRLSLVLNHMFVSYIVYIFLNIISYRPVFDECKMCDVTYDVIGQLESTTKDITFLSQAINVTSDFLHDPSYPQQAKMDAVIDSVESPFSWKKDIKPCMRLDDMARRIWRKLQIRGIIDSRIAYPFTDGDIEGMQSSTFIEACRKAIESSTDTIQLKKQKTQSFLEAYSSVPIEKLSALIKRYKDDFLAFQYDQNPVGLFDNRENVVKTDYLNWRTEWQLGLV